MYFGLCVLSVEPLKVVCRFEGLGWSLVVPSPLRSSIESLLHHCEFVALALAGAVTLSVSRSPLKHLFSAAALGRANLWAVGVGVTQSTWGSKDRCSDSKLYDRPGGKKMITWGCEGEYIIIPIKRDC
jgi:hypothetical protein